MPGTNTGNGLCAAICVLSQFTFMWVRDSFVAETIERLSDRPDGKCDYRPDGSTELIRPSWTGSFSPLVGRKLPNKLIRCLQIVAAFGSDKAAALAELKSSSSRKPSRR
jgi:hypothetical protein